VIFDPLFTLLLSTQVAKRKKPFLVPGPRKKRPKSSPGPFLSTHKRRGVWFRSAAAWPLREAAVADLVRERERATATLQPDPRAVKWECIGATNIGGRMTCAVCHPTEPNKIWAGAAGGGVWLTTDGGLHWQALWDKENVLNVGALAIDAKVPDTIYCGTGEANLSADSYPGVGLYRSGDGGKTWSLLADHCRRSARLDAPPSGRRWAPIWR
jgi:photosystem II stability/assembly factor-like uncharacterized protein